VDGKGSSHDHQRSSRVIVSPEVFVCIQHAGRQAKRWGLLQLSSTDAQRQLHCAWFVDLRRLLLQQACPAACFPFSPLFR